MGGIDGGVRAGSKETIAAVEESILRVDQLPAQQLVEFTDTTREREKNWKTEETYTTNCEEQILAQPNLYVATILQQTTVIPGYPTSVNSILSFKVDHNLGLLQQQTVCQSSLQYFGAVDSDHRLENIQRVPGSQCNLCPEVTESRFK